MKEWHPLTSQHEKECEQKAREAGAKAWDEICRRRSGETIRHDKTARPLARAAKRSLQNNISP